MNYFLIKECVQHMSQVCKIDMTHAFHHVLFLYILLLSDLGIYNTDESVRQVEVRAMI